MPSPRKPLCGSVARRGPGLIRVPRSRPSALLLVVVAASLLIGSGYAAAPSKHELAQAVERLRASVEEWRREDAGFRASRKGERLSKSEAEAYAEFVAGLRLRVLEQCAEVQKIGGEAAVKPFDCMQQERGRTASPNVIPAVKVPTAEEKRAALNARLNEIEADVDESLLKRQREIRQTATNQGTGASGASNAGGGEAGQPGGGSAGGSTGSGGKAGQEDAGQAQARAGGAMPSQGAPPSASGPGKKAADGGAPRRQASQDGESDDDVVARQLREAAEKETDPILRDKLWQEYKKYKESKR